MGASFKANMRNFPSLVNCTTIDYYHAWPIDALISVAKMKLPESEISLGDYKDSVIKIFAIMHKSVEHLSIK